MTSKSENAHGDPAVRAGPPCCGRVGLRISANRRRCTSPERDLYCGRGGGSGSAGNRGGSDFTLSRLRRTGSALQQRVARRKLPLSDVRGVVTPFLRKRCDGLKALIHQQSRPGSIQEGSTGHGTAIANHWTVIEVSLSLMRLSGAIAGAVSQRMKEIESEIAIAMLENDSEAMFHWNFTSRRVHRTTLPQSVTAAVGPARPLPTPHAMQTGDVKRSATDRTCTSTASCLSHHLKPAVAPVLRPAIRQKGASRNLELTSRWSMFL